MKIAISTVYGDYYAQNKLFDNSICKIGQNLLQPGIQLRNALVEMGHEYHTIDMYDLNDVDIVIFQDIGADFFKTATSPINFVKYVLKKRWKNDYLSKAIKRIPTKNMFLIMQEPEVVCPNSYKKEYHKYFNKILTWDDNLVDSKKYFKFFYPQPLPEKLYFVPYKDKRFATLIAGNKQSTHPNELYSERKKAIDLFENSSYEFDLYGFGWEKENLNCYKGCVDDKLETLSGYKFAICYENMCNSTGYITEKIFDCFFANCVPIYWGADNVNDYIPEDTFIDMRKFPTIEQAVKYAESLDEERYNEYLKNIEDYLKSSRFKTTFSVEAYVDNIRKIILDEQ